MQPIKLISKALILFACLSLNTIGQTPSEMAKAREFEVKAIEAYKAKDYPGFLSNIKQASDLRPNHPRILYNLAAAYGINNKPDDALVVLKRMAAMGLTFSIKDDTDFESLGAENRKIIEDLAGANRAPVNASTAAFTIPEEDLIPEGVTYDPATGKFYIGSTHKAKIVAIDKNGSATDFSSPSDGLWSVAGMAVDAKRRFLWACINTNTQMKGYDKSTEGWAGIAKYDLKTGKLVDKYLLPKTEKHVLGDLAIDGAGNVYATDSLTPTIYRLPANGKEFEIYLNSPEFVSLQGLAFSDNFKTLFVADYSKGVFKIDITSKNVTLLTQSDTVALLGIDGLYFKNGKLIAIQNGLRPNRVISIEMDKAQTKALSTKTLEANHANFDEPTLGVIAGNDLYYVANSQLNYFTQRVLREKTELKKPVILKVKIK